MSKKKGHEFVVYPPILDELQTWMKENDLHRDKLRIMILEQNDKVLYNKEIQNFINSGQEKKQ